MTFEWDDRKAAINLKKHKVPFEAAISIFKRCVTHPRWHYRRGEERSIVIGVDDSVRFLAVVYTELDEVIRIISARKATSKEIRRYRHDCS